MTHTQQADRLEEALTAVSEVRYDTADPNVYMALESIHEDLVAVRDRVREGPC